ncbi:unnamed protein product [Lepeophtheirus salmonis]|uniref:(salmon louse) hypothetical protein n=1 Tax=Lepeophtheirus salmonis TaxID=72036 RepID=A0A7R8CP07_LEPSM|nr:unnamed protein product [Lepeophtheirus salmonis]CAF2849469.1 unnamed protein product [Lepeophtheirus salmonis]
MLRIEHPCSKQIPEHFLRLERIQLTLITLSGCLMNKLIKLSTSFVCFPEYIHLHTTTPPRHSMNMVRFRGTEWHYTHPSSLTDNLYLSAARAITSAVLLELGITSLINATLEMPSMAYQKQECIQIAVEDRICSKLYVYFDLVADKIHSVHLSGGKILVYCRAGMSRSATLCIAYFIKYHDMNVSEAFDFVRERRPIIHPNIGFMRQLREYEHKLHHSKSTVISRGLSSPRTTLLSFATEEFCENEVSNTNEIPSFKLAPLPTSTECRKRSHSTTSSKGKTNHCRLRYFKIHSLLFRIVCIMELCRASVKTTGLKLSSGPSSLKKARILISDNALTLCTSRIHPPQLEKVSILTKDSRIHSISAVSILTLQYSINVCEIGHFSGEDLQDPPQVYHPLQREYPFYTIVTRRARVQTSLHTAVVLPVVEACWHFTLKTNRRTTKLNWAAERKDHGADVFSEFCRARPDVHYINQTPKNLPPIPKILAVIQSTPDSIRENPKILPRFLMTRYPSRTVSNMCNCPLIYSLNVRKPLILEYTNLYCEPRVMKVPSPKIELFRETKGNKLLQRRVALNVTQVEVRKESEDLMEIPSIKEASKFTELVENVKKEEDLNRLQIWFEVFKRYVLSGRPIYPFVAITELLQLPIIQVHPTVSEPTNSLSELFAPEYNEAIISTELSDIILKPTLQKVMDVLYCPGNESGDEVTEEQYQFKDSNEIMPKYVEFDSSYNDELFHGIADTLAPIVYAEVSDNIDGDMDSRYLQRLPFSIITGFKFVADHYMIQIGEESQGKEEKEEYKGQRIKKERPYIRYCPNAANETLENIAEPVDTFWYFQLDTPTAARVKEEDDEKKRQKEALLMSKNVSDSRYQLFLPDPETVKRIESEKKTVSFAEPKPVPTQRIGSLISYQRPRSRSRASSSSRKAQNTEDQNNRALKDLDASYKESNLLLERRRKPEYYSSSSSSPRTSAYYSSDSRESFNSLKGLLETAQKIIGGSSNSSSTGSSGIGTRASRSSVKHRYYKSPRS